MYHRECNGNIEIGNYDMNIDKTRVPTARFAPTRYRPMSLQCS